MRRCLAFAVSLALATFAAVASAGAATVKVGDNYFSPRKLTIRQHATVTFRFVGRKAHNVTVRRGPARFSSPSKRSGKYVRHFMKKGTYRLVCSIHAGDQRMTITVD